MAKKLWEPDVVCVLYPAGQILHLEITAIIEQFDVDCV